jgi:predicted ester cyclase
VSDTIHKQVVRRFYEEVWNRHDLTRLGEILELHFSFRGSLGPDLTGHTAFAAYVDAVHASLADYRCEILDLVGEGEKVVARMRFHGLHRGPLLSFAATGRRVQWMGSAHFTFAHGKIADLWVLGDLHRLMKQLSPDPA